jgi:hypothetical protein
LAVEFLRRVVEAKDRLTRGVDDDVRNEDRRREVERENIVGLIREVIKLVNSRTIMLGRARRG